MGNLAAPIFSYLCRRRTGMEIEMGRVLGKFMRQGNDSKETFWKSLFASFSLFFVVCMSLALFRNCKMMWDGQNISIASMFDSKLIWSIAISLLLSAVISAINIKIDIMNLLFKYRYYLAALLLLLCVLFEISGSSIGMWSNYLGVEDGGVLLGTSREIRSDEWAVSIPMVKSQYYIVSGSFSRSNDIIRAAATDAFSASIIAPTWDVLGIFKPFNLGYLFLPFAKGLAFCWCAKMIALFMVSFEFGRMITKDNRFLSLAYAALILFAPAIQWWSGGIAEMMIAFELATIMLNKYIHTASYRKRWLYALVIIWSAGMYIFTLYPAWQVPLFYIMLAVIVWILISGWKTFSKTYKDIFIVLTFIISVGAMAVYFYLSSREAITSVMNTVYPGARSENGGAFNWGTIFNYVTNMWYPYTGNSNITNVCESSQFLHFFPISIVVPIIAMIKRKKGDLLTICLLIATLFLSIYIFIGIPDFLAKITFMYTSPSWRAIVIWGLANILLLIRGIHLWEEEKTQFSSKHIIAENVINLLLSSLLAGVTIWFAYSLAPAYFNGVMLVFSFFTIFIIFFLIIQNTYTKAIKVAAWSILLISIFTGFLINPIRSGVSFFEKSDTITALQEVEAEDRDAIWVIDNLGYPYNNLGLCVGLNTINSTSPYPNLDRWHMIDPVGRYEDIYNRYAHIKLNISEEDGFDVIGPDYIQVYLSRDALEMYGVKYIFTNRDFDEFELIRTTSLGKIYKVQ